MSAVAGHAMIGASKKWRAAGKLAAGAALAAAVASLVGGGSGRPPRARVSAFAAEAPAPAPAPAPAHERPAEIAVAVTSPPSRVVLPSIRPVALAAPPITFANAPVCNGVRLVDLSGQGRDTTVWLGDAHGIEQLEPGQRFRDFTLLDVQAETEQAPALALLRGPNGTCRTARKREALDHLFSQVESAPPSVPAQDPPPTFALTPALAKQLVAALNLQPERAGQ